jgi:hypothetical protein
MASSKHVDGEYMTMNGHGPSTSTSSKSPPVLGAAPDFEKVPLRILAQSLVEHIHGELLNLLEM